MGERGNVPAGTKIRLEFANINNPLNPSANYQVTVTTRNAANTPIDGPTPSTAYTMKQIGANVIADNSITTTKPAESFMKRVTLLDNPAGSARGWNPDGVTTSFIITEPNGIDADNSIPIIALNNGPATVCGVNDLFAPSQFVIECTIAPDEDTELSYVVTNLPPHVIV